MKKILFVIYIGTLFYVPTSVYSENNRLELIMSKNHELCNLLESELNKNIIDASYKLKMIANLKWHSGQYQHGSSYNRRNVRFSSFDIDNDGEDEEVAVEQSGLFGIVGEQILIYDENFPDFRKTPELTSNNYINTHGVLLSSKWPYQYTIKKKHLLEKYKSKYENKNILIPVSTYEFIEYKSNYYLLIEPANVNKTNSLWYMLTKVSDKLKDLWRGDKRKVNEIEYICYLSM